MINYDNEMLIEMSDAEIGEELWQSYANECLEQ